MNDVEPVPLSVVQDLHAVPFSKRDIRDVSGIVIVYCYHGTSFYYRGSGGRVPWADYVCVATLGVGGVAGVAV